MSPRFVRAALAGIVVVGGLLAASGTLAEPEKPKSKEARIQADALFPLAPGTTWTWRRTVKRGDQPAKQTEETRKIVKAEPVEAYFKVVFDNGGPFYVNADGVFNQQCDRGGKCHYAALYPRPAKGQTSFRTTYGGDVAITVTIKPQTKPFVGPAGTFKNCVEYHFPISAAGRQVMYCPGVGVVQETFGDTVYGGVKEEEKVTDRLELLRFKKGS